MEDAYARQYCSLHVELTTRFDEQETTTNDHSSTSPPCSPCFRQSPLQALILGVSGLW